MENRKINSCVNYYKLLGVTSTATSEEITRGFRKQILLVHHDKNTDKSPTDICYDTLEAYRILSNRESRIKYDILWENETRVLSDRELLEKYKSEIPPNEPTQYQVIADFVAKFRQIENLNRKKFSESFSPAGAICYDVPDLLSTKFKTDIANRQKEFQGQRLNDNFFSSYAHVIEDVVDPLVFLTKYNCDLCKQTFTSDSHHWDNVLVPYLKYFRISPVQSQSPVIEISHLLEYFRNEIGNLFAWEPKYLPSAPFGVWGSHEWFNFSIICDHVKNLVSLLPYPECFSNAEEHMNYIQNCAWAGDIAADFMCWVLIYNEIETLVQKAHGLFYENKVTELLVYVAVLKEFLGFDEHDWSDLREQALTQGQIEMSLVWTMVSVELELISSHQWIQLALHPIIRNYENDPYLTHYCILFAVFREETTWDEVIDLFAFSHGDHFTAITYIMHFGSMSTLLSNYVELCDTNTEVAKIYRMIFYSQKLKSILSRLAQIKYTGKSDNVGSDLEELVEITQLIVQDPHDAFCLILKLYHERFDGPEFFAIHGRTIEILQSKNSELTMETLKLILAAWHFVGEENEVDEGFLRSNFHRLTKVELAERFDSCDFELLTNTLEKLNVWNVSAAEELLNEIQIAGNEEDIGNHVKAMKLMISGTVEKVHGNWVAATSAYQTALLNTPECNYRLTPCISKLTQDTQLHEGIMNEVQTNLRHLRNNFNARAYIQLLPHDDRSKNFDDYLVISHPTPQHEFGYKGLSSRIQTEEPKPPPEPGETLEGSTQILEPANTPEITLEKFERAIEVGQEKPLSPLDAAYAYVDLINSLPESMRHGPTVMAASHFLKAMDETIDVATALAFKYAIVELAQSLLIFDRNSQARVQSCLTHKHMFSILLMANQSLSKWQQEFTQTDKSQDCAESVQCEDNVDNFVRQQSVELVSPSDKTVIQKLLKSVVSFSKVEPLLHIPTLSCSDLGYVERVKTHFLHRFCSDKINQQECQVTPTHAYTLFLEVLHGRSHLISFELAKKQALEAVLAERRWTLASIERFIDWQLTKSNSEGWSAANGNLSFHKQLKSFESIEGFKINFITGQISFLLNTGKPIFTQQDIFEIFHNEITHAHLRLENPLEKLEPNICLEAIYSPSSLSGTEYLKTLLRISRLLNTFACGMEVNLNPPFLAREVEIGLLDHIPEHLQHFLRPLRERAPARKGNQDNFTHSFSLSLSECYYEENDDQGREFMYSLGEVGVILSCAEDEVETVISFDKNHNEEVSPAKSFASDFTKCYDEFGNYFPELLRLKELFKISVICAKLREILRETNPTENCKVYHSITSLGIGVENNESEELWDEFECHWVPSPSCHSHTNVIDVTTSLHLTPVPTYGPISTSTTSHYVSVEQLLTFADEEVDFYQQENEAAEDSMYEISTTVTVYLKSPTEEKSYSDAWSKNCSFECADDEIDLGSYVEETSGSEDAEEVIKTSDPISFESRVSDEECSLKSDSLSNGSSNNDNYSENNVAKSNDLETLFLKFGQSGNNEWTVENLDGEIQLLFNGFKEKIYTNQETPITCLTQSFESISTQNFFIGGEVSSNFSCVKTQTSPRGGAVISELVTLSSMNSDDDECSVAGQYSGETVESSCEQLYDAVKQIQQINLECFYCNFDDSSNTRLSMNEMAKDFGIPYLELVDSDSEYGFDVSEDSDTESETST